MKKSRKQSRKFQPTLPARGATGTTSARHTARIFQPTLPARGATLLANLDKLVPDISTHAPRTGSDAATDCLLHRLADFNPRSPHGERLFFAWLRQRYQTYFNPRSPHGERRKPVSAESCDLYFNPRSPHGERLPFHVANSRGHDFNPRSPHGERPCLSLT